MHDLGYLYGVFEDYVNVVDLVPRVCFWVRISSRGGKSCVLSFIV